MIRSIEDLKYYEFYGRKERTERVRFMCSNCNKEDEAQLRTLFLHEDLLCQRCRCKKSIETKFGPLGLKNKVLRNKIESTCLMKFGVKSPLSRKKTAPCSGAPES